MNTQSTSAIPYSPEQIVTISLSASAIIVLLLLFTGVLITRRLHSKIDRYFLTLVILATTANCAELIVALILGTPGTTIGYLIRILDFVNYLAGSLMAITLAFYIYEYLSFKRKISKKPFYIVIILCLTNIVFMAVSTAGNIFLPLNELNSYYIDNAFWLGITLFPTVVTIICIVIVLRYAAILDGKELASLLSYLIIIPVCYGIEMAFPGLWIVNFACAMAILLVYLNIQVEISKQLKDKELELAENRILIMLSQIQPHFQFNTLTTIEYLCERDGAKEAAKSVSDFSRYIRGNMDSLSRRNPIPFTKELKHTKLYVSIEQLQYENSLHVRYDIQEKDFLLPALTLQPIVENAIKHGIRNEIEKGWILIQTRTDEDSWLVTVKDNGTGFEVTDGNHKPDRDERSHIGIDNVRSRLEKMCGGTLTIKSSPGEGTETTLRIPKNAGNENIR